VAPAGGCWPTQDQVLLLRAAVLEPGEAAAAWRRWRAAHYPETAERASARLFPLVHRNVPPCVLSAPDADLLRRAYDRALARNEDLFAHAADALRRLHDDGIATIVLKGAALAVAYYRDPGVRPMTDVDVLVRPGDADRALAALTGAGWSTVADVTGRRIKDAYAQHLYTDAGGSVDLHWLSLAQYGSDDDFWSASLEIDLAGVRTRALAPEDQLLHVAAHGARWDPVPPFRWFADAAAVERAAVGGLDWERVVAQATQRRLTVALADALAHLAAAVQLPVPEWVSARLRAAPKAPLERWAHRAATRPAGAGTWLPVELDRYRRLARFDPSLRFSDFAKDHFGVHTHRELVRRMAQKAGQAALAQTVRRARRSRTGT
jgi:hypothetical protein